jgi:hypothetical protein
MRDRFNGVNAELLGAKIELADKQQEADNLRAAFQLAKDSISSHVAQLKALSLFYEGVRHTCGLPGTRTDEPYSTPERISETLETVTELYRKVRDADEQNTAIENIKKREFMLEATISVLRNAVEKLLTVATNGKKVGDAISMMRACQTMMAFWSRGDGSWRDAAAGLSNELRKALGDAFEPLRVLAMDTPAVVVPEPFASMLQPTKTVETIPVVTANGDNMPTIFDCGCSKHKVRAGYCDIYDEFGKERPSKSTP